MRWLAFAYVALFAWVSPARAAAQLVDIVCAKEAGELDGVVRTKILLAKAFLDERPEPEQLIDAAEHQLRYLWGHYRSDPVADAQLRVTLSGARPEVRVLSRAEVPYGRDLRLDWTRTEERLKVTDPYTSRAIARGRVSKTDPALLFDVELRFRIAICGRGESPPSVLHVDLPRDPWLLYWHVPRAKHRPLRYGPSLEVTNPCADNDFADLPHPFYYWYDWYAERHGPDAKGKPFDCRKWLHRGVDFDPVEVKLVRAGEPVGDYSSLLASLGNGPLRVTVVVGAIDHERTQLGLEPWRERIGAGTAEFATRIKAAREAHALVAKGDRGLHFSLRTLDEMQRFLAVERWQSDSDGDLLEVRVWGRLRASNRPIELRLVHTMTDILGPRPPKHWAALRRGILEDHVVVYWGHSGIGENFRLAQIESHTGISHTELLRQLARSPLRLIAFLSCYSYMYFGQDLLAQGEDRMLVFTGSGEAHQDRGPLPVLELLDDVLAKRRPHPTIGDDEVWIIDRATGHGDDLQQR